MRKARILLAVATVALTLSGGLYVASRNDTADAAPGDLIWSDEFDGPAGEAPDPAKWNYDIGGHGFGNNEMQFYNRENVAKDGNGNLVITAKKERNGQSCHYGPCEYTSSRILTANKFSQRYGRFEARIKIPRGQGIWPAFWMLGADIGTNPWPASGEIDIMENVGKEPNNLYGTVHGPGYNGGGSIGGRVDNGRALADDFHTYGVEWTPNLIVWFLDGREFFRITPGGLKGNPWVFDKPFFMILNLAVGGHWPGYPDDSTQFPQQMVIDYVRVSEAGGSGNGGGDNGGGGNPTNPPPAAGTGSLIKSVHSGRCIDIPGGRADDGARLQMWDCIGGAAQQWKFDDKQRLTAMGKCLDPAWGSSANGTAIQLVTCSDNPVQRFTLDGDKNLVNYSSNKCVDIVEWGSGNGARLQLWDCAGTANQKWNWA